MVIGAEYAPNPFEIAATVSNNDAGTASDIRVSLYLPAGVSLARGLLHQSAGDLAPGQQRRVTWSVRADGRQEATTLEYLVTALASNAARKTAAGQVTLPALITLAATRVSPQPQRRPSSR